MTLWDSCGDPGGERGVVYCWNGYAERPFAHSLLHYVETHSDRLRAKYAAWTHDLGESRINGQRLIDHLACDGDLSYWWMTLFVEQSIWKSPAIIDAIRLLAFEEILLRKKPDELLLVSSDRRLHQVLVALCRRLGITYSWNRLPRKPRRRWSLKSLFHTLPQSLQGLTYLARYVSSRWSFKRQEKGGWFGGCHSLFVCSVFAGVDPSAANEGRFDSSVWPGLQPLLHGLGHRGNWLHLFAPSSTGPTPVSTMEWVRTLNSDKKRQGVHSVLDAYLSPRLVGWVLSQWFRLSLVTWRLRPIRKAFRPHGSQLSLWPVMQRDWFASTRGADAISNLMWIRLFDVALGDLPRQATGLYAHENQSWERALIHAWRKHNHGRLIAVAHSTIRFWDLRYIADPRTRRSSAGYRMPQADFIALNGHTAIDVYRSGSFPAEAILECEALRYNYLLGLAARRQRRAQGAENGDPIKVLVLGDYTRSATETTLRLLQATSPALPPMSTYTIKPHPNHLVVPEDYPALHLAVVTDPLSSLFTDYDVALSTNLTSAALDAYLVGLNVVVTLEATSVNLSPLRGQSGVNFVSAPEDLARALQMAARDPAVTRDPHQVFFLDPNLPRWRRTLSSCGAE